MAELIEKINVIQKNIYTSYTPKGAITFIDDDGRTEVFTKLHPMFKSRRLKYVSALISDSLNTDDYITVNNAKQMEIEGCEIASHCKTHINTPSLPYSGQVEEIIGSYNQLKGFGLDVQNLVYPYGAFNEDTIKIAKQVYNCSCKVNDGNNALPLEQFALRRIAMGSYFPGDESGSGINTFAHYKSQIDNAMTNNEWCIFMLHSFNTSDEQFSIIEQVLNYCVSSNINVINLRDGVDLYGNVVDVGAKALGKTYPYFQLGKDGIINTNISQDISNTYYLGQDKILLQEPLATFPKNKISIANVTFGKAIKEGYPDNRAGIDITYRFGDDGYSRRLYYSYQTNDIYSCFWNDSAWSPFTKVNGSSGASSTGLNFFAKSNYTIDFGTTIIATGSTVSKTVDISNILSTYGDLTRLESLTINPIFELPDGLTYQVCIEGNKSIKIKLNNLQSGDIKIPQIINFNISIMN